jgi:hypothetical protein
MPRCQHGGRVYAVGRVGGVSNVGLQRTRAARSARVALFGSAHGKLEARASEVRFFARCGSEQLALASVPVSEVPGAATLPACPAAISTAPDPAAGCPPWTARISWREAATIHAVAVVDGIANAALAERAGANRARVEAADVVHWTATVDGAGFVRSTQLGSVALSSSERALCGGLTYVKVSAAAP